MQETLEKILTILHGTWRFRWHAMIVAWIIGPIGWMTVYNVPNLYVSSAQIYVDTDSVLRPMLQGIALESNDPSELLGMMTKELFSRSNLEKVLRDVDLDVEAMTPRERDNILATLESNVEIKGSRTHRSVRMEPHNLYTISSRNTDPEMAFKIVHSLLDIFIEQALGDTRKDTEQANQFLDKQIQDYEERLNVREEKLRKFKQENIDHLPEQGNSFIQRIQATQSRLEEIELELREERNRRSELNKQLADVNPTQVIIGSDGQPIQSPLEQRINALQVRLDELKLRYTDFHPEVIETQAAIDSLKKQRDAQQADGITTEQANNPMYQQIRISLGQVESNIAALEVRRSEYSARLTELKAQVGTLPKVEAELLKLQRDYDEIRTTYNNLVQRRHAADLTVQADQTGEKVKLKIIEAPIIAVTPVSPNRLLLNIFVLFLAIGGGLGIAFLLSQIRPAFYGQRMLKQHLELPVLGSVSMLSLPSIVARRKLQLFAFFFVGGLLMAAFILAIFLQR